MNTMQEHHTRFGRSVVALFSLVFLLLSWGGSAEAKGKYRLVYFDGHMHTNYSDGQGTVADIKQVALERGLDAVIVTDHSTSLTLDEWQALVAETAALTDCDLLMIPSVEVTGKEGQWHRDHFLAWGIKDIFVGDDADLLKLEQAWPSPINPEGTGPMYPEHIENWIDYIHSQKGMAVQAHPLGTTQPEYGVDFIELYNLGIIKGWTRFLLEVGFPEREAWENATLLSSFAIHGNRDLNMMVEIPGFPPMPLRIALYNVTLFRGIGQWLGAPEAAPIHSWDELLMNYVNGVADHPVFGVANTDSHNTANTVLNDAGYDDSDVGEVKNGVYVKAKKPRPNPASWPASSRGCGNGDSAGVSEKELFKALRAGRSFATTGPSLYFDVDGEPMGGTARRGHGPAEITIRARAEDPDAILVKVDVIKNGRLWTTLSPQVEDYETVLADTEDRGNGYYRVEVVSWDPAVDKYRFAWGNPVFVVANATH